MKIKRKEFGMLCDGTSTELWELRAGGLVLTLTNFGASMLSLSVPSKDGRIDDVLLGFSTLEPLTRPHPFFGATIGRFGNRIGASRFELDGTTYTVPANEGKNCLHGGIRGFDRRVWQADSYKRKDAVFVRFSRQSPDGEEGFPGTMEVSVTYGLSKAAELSIEYHASLDKRCPVNLTNHAYFNLKGEGQGTILDHELTMNCSKYLPVDAASIPNGQLAPVEGTAFDFRTAKPVGRDIADLGSGYDHCLVVDGEAGILRNCARVYESESGRSMIVTTTHPGVQFYTGNFLDTTGKNGSVYSRHSGFCLETQQFPDAPNQPSFPDSIYGPERPYHEKDVYAFDW